MTLEQNKKAREEAEAAFALLCETVGEQTERFWETMAQLSTGKLPPQSPTIQAIEPMTDDEASDLEREFLGDFGVFRGEKISCVPTWYCCVLAGESRLSKRMQRYVRSKRFRDRQDRGE